MYAITIVQSFVTSFAATAAVDDDDDDNDAIVTYILIGYCRTRVLRWDCF